MCPEEIKEQLLANDEINELPPFSLDVVYSEIKDKLDVQLRQIESLDNKVGNILFIASIVIGIGAAAQAAILGNIDNAWVLLLFSIPIIFYLLTVFTSLHSWVVKTYFRDPKPRPLRDEYLFQQQEFTKRRLITHFISTYEWNAAILKKKVRELRWSTWFFLAETLSLTMVLLIRAWLA